MDCDGGCMHITKPRTLVALTAALMLMGGPVLAKQAAPVRPAAGSGGDIVNYGQIHSPVVGRGGMVVSQNTLASRIGADILEQGGNAVDAAVAMGFALAVTLPRAGNREANR